MIEPCLKLFLTGEPGCGKTTVIRRVIDGLGGSLRLRGFWTEEMLERGRRRGFRGVTLDGVRFRLAEVGLKSPFEVGPYGVDLEDLEAIGVPALSPGSGVELVVLDEVGKMECFSEAFRRAVEALLAGTTPVLATIALHGVGFIKRVRQDPRIELMRMGRASREAACGEILRRLARAGIRGEERRP